MKIFINGEFMRLIVCFLFLLAFIGENVEAKYVYPEGSTTTTERKVNRRVNNYDADSDGVLSLQEYQDFRKVRTRDDRRMERRAKKKGTYVSPEDAFAVMDKNKDGKISKKEMLDYEKENLQK